MSGNTTPGLTRIPDLQKVTEIGNVTDQAVTVEALAQELTSIAQDYCE